MKVRTRIIVGVTGAAVVAATSFTVASASVPDSNDVIHACYTTSSGALRVIDTDNGGSCYSYETAISWPSKAPSLKYFTGTATVNSSHDVSEMDCPDGGMPVSVWFSGSDPYGNAGTYNSRVSLTNSSGNLSDPPSGLKGSGDSNLPVGSINYELICT